MWEKVARLMDERKITIAELSRATGIPATTIYTWKDSTSGKIVRADNLAKLAKFFGVTIEDLM